MGRKRGVVLPRISRYLLYLSYTLVIWIVLINTIYRMNTSEVSRGHSWWGGVSGQPGHPRQLSVISPHVSLMVRLDAKRWQHLFVVVSDEVRVVCGELLWCGLFVVWIACGEGCMWCGMFFNEGFCGVGCL